MMPDTQSPSSQDADLTATQHPGAVFPPLYLSHGSPMIAIEDSPAARFLTRLGPVLEATFGRPKAVVVVSPHSSTRQPLTLAADRHEAIHDFGGFPAELYQQTYSARGDTALALAVAQRLQKVGLTTAKAVEASGLDHGIWTLLKRMWPGAEIPVVPLTLVPNWTPAQQWRVGQALADLGQQGVLVIGSGAMTHNLHRFFSLANRGLGVGQSVPVVADVAAFQAWVQERAAAQDWEALRNYRQQAPSANLQHPTDEHWLPFYVAAAAGGEGHPGVRVHDSVDGGVLAMDGYAFGPSAPRLAAALAEAA